MFEAQVGIDFGSSGSGYSFSFDNEVWLFLIFYFPASATLSESAISNNSSAETLVDDK